MVVLKNPCHDSDSKHIQTNTYKSYTKVLRQFMNTIVRMKDGSTVIKSMLAGQAENGILRYMFLYLFDWTGIYMRMCEC